MNLPNLITLSRVPTLFIVVALLGASWHGAAAAAFGIFVLGGFTDWLDGYLARRFGQISTFGKLMDALTDKILFVGLMVALLAPMPSGPALLPGWSVYLVLLIFSREFLITGLRLVAASQGIVLAAERSGKIKTVLQIVSIGMLLLAHALEVDFQLAPGWIAPWQVGGLWVFGAAAVLTAVSGAGYLVKYWDVFMGRPRSERLAKTDAGKNNLPIMPTWEQCRRAFGWVNYLPNGLVCGLATLGPVGKIGPAPGTSGTAFGIFYFWVIYPRLPAPWGWALLAFSVYFAVAICDSAERRMKLSDPGCIILDEVVAMPFCFLPNVLVDATLHDWPWWVPYLAVFLLFRLFDVAKPFGIKRVQKLPGGLGVVVDDVVAALATALVLNGWLWTT